MKYSYRFKLNKQDMFRYYMVDRYSSLAGVVQIIFIVSMVLLVLAKWDTLGVVMRILVLVGLSLFTIIQPLAFYIKAKKTENPNVPDTEITFNEIEMIIQVQNHIQKIKYENVVQVIKKPLMLIVQPDQKHIYILPDRVLGSDKKELFEYLKEKILA